MEHKTDRKPNAASSALTLIELMVVMLIMAIILSVSIPAFVSIGRGYGIRATVNNVYNHLALARQWAITHKKKVTFEYSSTGSTFYVYQGEYPYDSNTCMRISSVITNSLDVNFQNDGSVTFKTDGGLDGLSASIVILDQKSGGTVSRTLTINSLTGGIGVE